MVIGVLQFELLIHGAQSLKDKRRVVNSVKDRLHREHLVSIAEVGNVNDFTVAVLGLALVGREGKHVGEVMDRILAKLRQEPYAELGDTSRQILYGAAAADPPPASDAPSPATIPSAAAPRAGLRGHEHDFDDEMRRRAEELDLPQDWTSP